MAIELVTVSRNTRGLNSRTIEYKAIGKYTTKTVERESKPVFNEDGTPKLDDKGNQVREPLGKDAEGKQITYKEEVQEFETAGVLTDMEDALALVDNDEQRFLDFFVEGYNEWAYAQEASKDELDEFVKDMGMNDDTRNAFKRTVRALSKNTDTPVLEAAEIVKAQLMKNKAKKEAA